MEEIFFNGLRKAGAREEDVAFVSRKLGELRELDENTYLHSLRVGAYALRAADALNIDNPAEFGIAAALHDYGKTRVDQALLKDHENHDDYPKEKMRVHAVEGFQALEGEHPLAALTSLLHHAYKAKEPYPKQEEIRERAGEISEEVNRLALIVNVLDAYDAHKTRPKKRGREPNVRKWLLEHHVSGGPNGEHAETVRKLFESGVLENGAD